MASQSKNQPQSKNPYQSSPIRVNVSNKCPHSAENDKVCNIDNESRMHCIATGTIIWWHSVEIKSVCAAPYSVLAFSTLLT
mmetsp:Transcript_27566/g.50220  ORF Transcript_27566/g.50220 Transcript_27566/m.50220 type:complete len:81 (+) Transcript_27566:203-445(+)